MAERGVQVDHATRNRWVVKYSPDIAKGHKTGSKRQQEARQTILKADVKATEKQIDGLLERIMGVSSSRVINAYETKIEKLERNKRVLVEKLQSGGKSNGRFNDFIEHALTFLANPWKIWDSGKFTLQRTVLGLAFSERIAYCRNEGYRTSKTTLPFKVLQGGARGIVSWCG